MRRAPAAPILLAAALVAGCAATPEAPPPPPDAALPPRDAPPTAVATLPPATAEPTAAPAPPAAPAPLAERVERPVIDKVFDRHKRHFHKLYQARVAQRPGFAGAMLVDFTIAPDGAPRDVALAESNLRDPAFEQDVLRQIEAMRFPPATAATPVRRYPIYFKPGGTR